MPKGALGATRLRRNLNASALVASDGVTQEVAPTVSSDRHYQRSGGDNNRCLLDRSVSRRIRSASSILPLTLASNTTLAMNELEFLREISLRGGRGGLGLLVIRITGKARWVTFVTDSDRNDCRRSLAYFYGCRTTVIVTKSPMPNTSNCQNQLTSEVERRSCPPKRKRDAKVIF